MATVARSTIKADVANRLNRVLSPSLAGLVMPRTMSANGSTTTIKDTLLGRGTRGTDHYNNCQVDLLTNGEAAGVDQAGFDATDTLTISPAVTSTEANDEYLLLAPPLTRELLNQEADNVLIHTEAPYLYFPSMLPDNAAYMGGVATSVWADETGTPTQTYDTADGYTLFGEQSLKVVTSTVDHSVTSGAIDVVENEVLLLQCWVACPTGSVTIQLYDDTNGAEIEAAEEFDDPAFHSIKFHGTVPADCEQVSVRFIAKTASSTFYVAAPVVLQSQSGHLYGLPSWFQREGQFRRSLELPQGVTGETEFTYLPLGRQFSAGPKIEFLRNSRAATPFSASFGVISRPVAFDCYRAFDAFSSDSDTTTCDREYLMWKMMANIMRAQDDARWRSYAITAGRLARDHRYGDAEKHSAMNREVAV